MMPAAAAASGVSSTGGGGGAAASSSSGSVSVAQQLKGRMLRMKFAGYGFWTGLVLSEDIEPGSNGKCSVL